MYFKACNAISGITKWPAKHYYSLRHSEKSRNLDTVDTLLRLEFLTTRAVTIRKIQKKKHLMHLSLLFFSISGKAEGKAEKQDVNGNEPENHSHLRFYLELKGQRRVPAGTELTIRYNSVFEVHFWRENSNS